MKVRCAWHKQNFGFVKYLADKPPYNDPGVSDTICSECYRIEIEKEEKAKKEGKRE